MGVTLKQLRHAQALAKFGNFRRAAAAEHLTQPAFSRSIQMLETYFEVPLFDRLAEGVVPTVYGETLLQRAETILIESEELGREVDLLRGLEAGRLSVAMGIYSADVSGYRAIAALAREYPRLRCQVRVTDWPDVMDLVISRQADIGFAELSMAQKDPRLQVVSMAPHSVALFARRGHPLSGAAKLSKSDLDAFPLATVRLPPRVADLFPGMAHVDNESGALVPALELNNMDLMRTLVLGSDAFGMAAPVQFDRPDYSENFVVLPYREPWMHLNYGLIFLNNRTLSPSAERFMEIILAIEKEVELENEELMRKHFPAD